MEYRGVVGEVSTERIIEKSRFIAYLARTVGEEEAKAYLAKVRSLHPLATHVCYGFIADKTGNLQRFSDDGEPQGTAGMPILGVLKAQDLREVTVAVVRYFGGIKLGAGGLVRAYSAAAADAVAVADKRNYAVCVELELTIGYPEVSACLRFLEGRGIALIASDYAEEVTLTVTVRENEEAELTAAIVDALLGKVKVKSGKRYFYPFSM